MALTFYWNCEAADFSADNAFDAGSGTCYSAGADVMSGQGGVTLSATAAKTGTNGILTDAGGEFYRCATTSLLSAASGCIGFWVYFTTLEEYTMVFRMYDASDADEKIRMYTAASNAGMVMEVSNSGINSATVTTSGFSFSTGNWYFVVGRWSSTNQDIKVEVYNTSGTLLGSAGENTSVASDAFPSDADIDTFDFSCEIGSGSSQRGYMDNVFLANDYAEDLVAIRDIDSYQDTLATSIVPQAMANYRMRAA